MLCVLPIETFALPVRSVCLAGSLENEMNRFKEIRGGGGGGGVEKKRSKGTEEEKDRV